MIDAQKVTSRMMGSASRSKSSKTGTFSSTLIKGYLAAFGVVSPINLSTYPPVFKDTHVPEWRAFLKEFHDAAAADPERNALYTLLEFVRYMKHMGINPFIRSLKPPPAALKRDRLEVSAVYENLLYTALEDLVSEILPRLRKTHLLTALSPIGPARTSVVPSSPDKGFVLYSAYALKTKRKADSLDGILSRLQGFLFSDSDTPSQLRDTFQKLPPHSRMKAKSTRSKASTLMSATSSLGWLIVSKTDKFSIYVTRAKADTLVLRIEVAIPAMGIDLGSKAKSTIAKSWIKAFAAFK